MMRKLESYLENIRTFLPGKEPEKVEEILREIESHILERAEREHGDTNDASVAITIKEYGSAEEVAARYYEGGPIIAPHLRNYLFMYTGILFAIHMGLHLLSFIFGENGAIFRFSGTDLLAVISQIPVTFIFDFGLVSLILYFVTKAGATSSLPYFTWFLKNDKTPSTGSRIGSFVAAVIGSIVTYLAFTFGPVYISDGQVTTLTGVFFDSFKFGLFLGFGLLVIAAVFAFINIFNYSRITKITSSIVSLIFLFIVVSPDYSSGIASYLNIPADSTGHPLLTVILLFIAVITIIELVLEIIRFWASRVVKTQ
jgi:hypothetical protein